MTEVINIDKLTELMKTTNRRPVGQDATTTAETRAQRSQPYREARDEYARIRAPRKISPVAAHLRERRFELGMTQEQVAAAVGTSHTNISRLERGAFTPRLATLQRIAAILDEEVVLCFQRTVDGEVKREFAAILVTEASAVPIAR